MVKVLRKSRKLILYFGFCFLVACIGLHLKVGAQSPYQHVIDRIAENSGEIDWTDMEIVVRGMGSVNPQHNPSQRRPMAYRAAKVDAYRNLLEITKGVEVNSETTVENAMVKSDIIKTKVQGIVQGAKVIKTSYMNDGTVEVRLAMAIDGELMDAVIPDTEWKVPKPTPIETPPTGTPPPPPPPPSPPPAPGGYTGLIIIATGLKVKPALAPKILSETGEELYGTEFLSEEVGEKEGIVWYSRSLDQAKANKDRAGTNPLIVRATKAGGKNMCDVVVPKDAADKLKEIGQNLSFLDECKVVFVID